MLKFSTLFVKIFSLQMSINTKWLFVTLSSPGDLGCCSGTRVYFSFEYFGVAGCPRLREEAVEAEAGADGLQPVERAGVRSIVILRV
jgi:hypothetical protein